jgi:sulfatase modifying factor 1
MYRRQTGLGRRGSCFGFRRGCALAGFGYALAGFAFAIAGCGGGNAGTEDAGVGPDGTGEADADDDGGLVLSRCPTTELHGPPLARVRWSEGIAFCIDSTEVTNGQYAEFLAGKVTTAEQPERCGWNQSYQPAEKATNGPPCPTFDPAARPDHPVVCVDWCDARAYCKWAGKRLCEAPGGGSVGDWTVANASEWVIACSGDQLKSHPYPYGMTAEPGRCVDQEYPSPMPSLQPAKTALGCEGGVPGLFDMSGNAGERHNDCVAKTGDTKGDSDVCPPLGGSFAAKPSDSSCTAGPPFLRNQVAGDIGFRCCTDAEF